MTFIKAMQNFLDDLKLKNRSQRTIKTYKNNLLKFQRFLLEKYNCQIYIDQVTADDLEKYLSEEINVEKYLSSYRYNIITAYKSIFNYCFMKEYTKTNISKQVKQLKPRIKERVYLTSEEFETLIVEIDSSIMRAIGYTMYYAGLRISECINLTLSDVDFTRNTITVQKDKEKHTRVIPINHKLGNILIEYLDYVRGETESEKFFATKSGSVSECYVNMALREATSRTELNKVVTCHIFRHSFASNLIAKGVDLYKIKKLLGHTDLKVTGIYLHTNLNELRNAVNTMN